MKITFLEIFRAGATAALLLFAQFPLPAQEVNSATIMSTVATPVTVAPVYRPKSQSFSNQFVVDSSQWHANGELTNSESGLSGNNFSLISATTTGPENIAPFYEASMTLKLASSGGVYDLYLGASQDAVAGELSTGQYYALEISNLTFSGNNCQARAQLLESQDGVTTVLATKQVACHDGITYHAALRRNYQLVTYADKESIMSAVPSLRLYGQPGVGGRDIRQITGSRRLVQTSCPPRTCAFTAPYKHLSKSLATRPLLSNLDGPYLRTTETRMSDGTRYTVTVPILARRPFLNIPTLIFPPQPRTATKFETLPCKVSKDPVCHSR